MPTTDLRWADIESVTKKDWSLSLIGRNRSTKGVIRFYIPFGSQSRERFEMLGLLASTMAYHGVRVLGDRD